MEQTGSELWVLPPRLSQPHTLHSTMANSNDCRMSVLGPQTSSVGRLTSDLENKVGPAPSLYLLHKISPETTRHSKSQTPGCLGLLNSSTAGARSFQSQNSKTALIKFSYLGVNVGNLIIPQTLLIHQHLPEIN